MMARIVSEAESHMRQEDRKHPTARRTRLSIAETICEATAHAADDLDLRGIALFTVSGFTAKQLSKYHPSAPIFALSRIEATVNRLSLLWGTTPIHCGYLQTAEEMVDCAEDLLAKGGYVRPREVIAIVAGTRTKSGSTNFMRLHVMGENSQAAARNSAASEEAATQPSVSLRRRNATRRVAPDKENASRAQI
jgi:pyruvate kinase